MCAITATGLPAPAGRLLAGTCPTADFHALATAPAQMSRRRALCLLSTIAAADLSDYDRDPGQIHLPTEVGDVIAVLTALKRRPP